MGTLSSLLSIAQGALSAHAAAVDITGKNITNANTPGYVRRQALLETRMLGRDQSGGVVFNGPLRMSDRFAVARVLAESGQFGAALGRQNALAGLEATLAPAGEGGISGRFNAFFTAVGALGQNPNDPTARAAFLARADELGQSFRTAAEGLAQRRTDLKAQAGDVAGQINSRLAEVADLNEKIAQAQALGDAAPDLRDRREMLVREVGDRMGVQAIEEDDGAVTLLSSGTALVTKGDASKIAVGVDAQGALAISVVRPGGTPIDITSRVDSGTLGGIRQARDTDVVALQ
ncbi:MAG: flagellar hook-associated protein FlgK, partial [Myxococcales bacterium]|nr:flagellar hook-associated protein FlgK [Myxococcales bacterium]